MAKEILRKDAQKLIEAGAQILDVLELSEYRDRTFPAPCTSTCASSPARREKSSTPADLLSSTATTTLET